MIRSKIASRFKSAKTMGFLWAMLALALHVVPGAVGPARAQGSRKDDIVFNSRGIPLAGATVRVCAMPASGQPCTPLALIYSDAALTQALANPTTTDGLGNYFFYAAPGKYEIEISGPAITTKQIPNVILPKRSRLAFIHRRRQRLFLDAQRQPHRERQHHCSRQSRQRHAEPLKSKHAAGLRRLRHRQSLHQDRRQ